MDTQDKKSPQYVLGALFFIETPEFKNRFAIDDEQRRILTVENDKVCPNSPPFLSQFMDGFYAARYKFWYKKVKADDFLKELKDLLLKYNANLYAEESGIVTVDLSGVEVEIPRD
jgi:hypothetical protein